MSKKLTVAILTLAVAFFGLSGLALAGGLEEPQAKGDDTQKQLNDLKDQLSSLTQAINELKQENNLLKAKDSARERELSELKGKKPSVVTTTGDLGPRLSQLENQLGAIKISGGLIGTVFQTMGHDHGGSGSGQTAVATGFSPTLTDDFNSEDNTINGDQSYGAYAFWLDVEAPISKNAKIFAELEANGNSSGVLEQQPFPSLHLPNGIATFSTNLFDGATQAGFINTRQRTIDVLNLLELYVEAKWFDNRLTTQVGKIDLTNYIDHSKYASSDRNQFLAKGLAVNPALLSTMPLNTIGARVAWSEKKNLLWDFFDGYQVQFAAVKHEDDGRMLFGNIFGIAEWTLTSHALYNRELAIRQYAFVDGGNDLWNTQTCTNKMLGVGWGFDYELIPDKLGIFSRFGFNTNQVASLNIPTVLGTEAMGIKYAWQIGGEYKGPFKNRPEDVVGFAFSQIHIYDDTCAYWFGPSDPINGDAMTGGTILQGKPRGPESFLELYYNYKLRDNIHVSPFIQTAIHPAGDKDSVSAIGARSQITF